MLLTSCLNPKPETLSPGMQAMNADLESSVCGVRAPECSDSGILEIGLRV